MTAQLTLLIPGLLEAVAHLDKHVPRLSALETLLSRADRSKLDGCSYYQCIENLFGQQDKQSVAPNAAISRLGEGGEQDQRYWLHLDPIYMQADKDRLILRGNNLLELTKSEVSTLLDELNELYREDDYRFESYHPQHWYLGIPNHPECGFSLLSDVLGRNVESFLPTGKTQTHWRRFMNEIQMQLHASSINEQRLEEDAYPVNSVWCWGGGVVSNLSSNWDRVYSDDPLVAGLANLSDAKSYALVENADALLQSLSSANHTENAKILVVFSYTEHHILNNTPDFWLQYLQNLETQWFQPLLTSLKNRQLSRIDLLTTQGNCYSISRKSLAKWWRRRQPIANYLN